MLSHSQLKNYASIRGLSIRDIEAYCKLSAGHISNILNGERPLSEENYRHIANAINAAYAAKTKGTFKRAPLDENKNAIKTEINENDGNEKSVPKRRSASK